MLYEDNDNSRHTIEFQMRGDWFAFGYKNRIVERKKIIPFFDITHDTDTLMLDKETWKRVNRKVNKLRLNNFNDKPSN